MLTLILLKNSRGLLDRAWGLTGLTMSELWQAAAPAVPAPVAPAALLAPPAAAPVAVCDVRNYLPTLISAPAAAPVASTQDGLLPRPFEHLYHDTRGQMRCYSHSSDSTSLGVPEYNSHTIPSRWSANGGAFQNIEVSTMLTLLNLNLGS